MRTVISVDGARPDVVRAHSFGLRYVHLPIGYDGVPREQALRIARATDPDLDPPHEALLLREAYTEAARLPETKQRSEELHHWLKQAAESAKSLADALVAGKKKGAFDGKAVGAAFKASADVCAQCHRKYRDVPQRRSALPEGDD